MVQKKLILINGTMGVGKSTVCSKLLDAIPPGVYLDGDWCWNMSPFVVSDENKNMVLDNIIHLLKAFLHNSGYKNVVFCWVIHDEHIFEEILEPLKEIPFELIKITLICSPQVLRQRLEHDVNQGIRQSDVVERSLARLPLYQNMDTHKLDVSQLTVEETVREICQMIGYSSEILC